MASIKSGEQVKIVFRLEKDEDGYPPNEWESLWATIDKKGGYVVDNTPFFVREISCGDTISAVERDGKLFFDQVVKKSGNSVVRVIVYDERDVADLRDHLLKVGCESEQSHIPHLISVEIPETASLDSVLEFLDSGEADGKWEYETASIRS